ncbi:hypothetical protein F4677DRAFT_464877 [Hypoxylon crocopeplum]|nr:hypothetical protein F4677DRAFT_464877 [Hypoxylon crocopeplum]
MSPYFSLPDNEPENLAVEPIAICGMSCRLPGGIDSDSSFWKMLIEKRTGQTPKVPASRFNIDAHYHENLDRPGSFNIAGGYFLDGRPEDFDPTFFNITPIEAQWLDPQQRKILEVTYECLESAGASLESVAGSNTAVFVGSFTADYQQMSIRDPDFRHNYAATGVDPGIISNRVGNVFNLNGPSFTINTACSSSIYALHNACNALRSGDCDAAIVGGVNLILTVDQHMNTAKLGILSPTSTCHTFDASADGYGRAEGVGALFVKRLADAIRDGDPIRGVVLSTAVNTNGKVEGMGITHPSIKGQERVVRMAYEKANLDPNLTAYAELHGTGTPVGDPIEVRAISQAMNDTRPLDKPLLIGAVKPNIGHSEAASGIFAVMKATLMTEAALIPGVALFQNLNPAILEKEWNARVHADTAPWPKDSVVRRASVSSFGYGGTNGHVIIESIDSLYPWYQHAKSKKEAQYNRSSEKPFLLCFSAHDKPTLSRNIAAIAAVAPGYYLTDLSHTLNLHRTKFSHRAFTVAREGREVEAFADAALQSGVAPKKDISIGFLFTGQGAQWAGMGRVALREFPGVRETIQKLDRILGKLEPSPDFSMVDLLLEDTEATAGRINQAEVSQPLCTAIQIALVDLFSEWDITPQVSIGHSSGEIGAAYAAGLISAPEAIIVAFCRGRAVAAYSESGSMLAVGLGPSEIQEYLPPTSEDVCIACENSPSSVTLSGRTEPVSQLCQTLNAKGIFARALQTGRAYHSPHMAAVGMAYDVMLAGAMGNLSDEDLLWCRPRSQMISSVTGEPIADESNSLPASYWTANLRQRVLFNTAVQRLGYDKDYAHINYIVEVGPHSALAGPFKQICRADEKMANRFTYVPSLVRNRNDADQLLSVAGSLFVAGYTVDLEEVNSAGFPSTNNIRKSNTQYLLVDLPPYQWNYEKRYWAEPRASAEQRARSYPRHDLLGSRISGLSSRSAAWRNVLRQRDIPWLKDHNLGGTAIFPAAGYLSVAVEALRQLHESAGLPLGGVTLRDVDIKKALVVPNNDDGVEIVARLQESTMTETAYSWYTFSMESLTEGGEWTVHCEGRISASYTPSTQILGHDPVDESILTQRVSGKRWYDAFHRVGFYYGKAFQQLQQARTDRSVCNAAGDVIVRENSGIMTGESRYLVHPTTIDACLQLIIISIHAGKHKEMPWGVVPIRIEEMSLFAAELDQQAAAAAPDSTTGHARAWTNDFDGRSFNTNVRLGDANGRLLLDIKNLTCITYDAALPAGSASNEKGVGPGGFNPFSVVKWKPDIESLRESDFIRLWPALLTSFERLAKCVELISHRQAVKNALIIADTSNPLVEAFIDTVLGLLPCDAAVAIGFIAEAQEHVRDMILSERIQARVSVVALSTAPESWPHESAGPHDLVLVGPDLKEDIIRSETVSGLVKGGGWLLGSSATPILSSLRDPMFTLQIGQQFALLNSPSKTVANEADPGTASVNDITVLSVREGGSWHDLQSILSESEGQHKVRQKFIKNFHLGGDNCIVIDDTAGAISASMLADSTSFETIKAVLTSDVRVLWVTSGARQGRAAAATAVRMGAAEGLLRVLRSEQAASKIGLLDFDLNEEPRNVSAAIVSRLEAANTKDSSHDTEFWLHKGVLQIGRVYPKEDMNNEGNQIQPQEKSLDGILKISARPAEGHLVFEDEGKQRPALADDEIELRAVASQWPSSTRGSQVLVGGTIIRAGSAANQALIGKGAVAFVYDGFQTTVHTSAYAVLDEFETGKISLEVLVGILPSLCPMLRLCLINAKLEKDDFVLSLPGPKTEVSALAMLAKALGWNMNVVARSNHEKDQYISQFDLAPERILLLSEIDNLLTFIRKQHEKSSSGVITIVSHGFDSTSQEVWRYVPPSTRFLLLNSTSSEIVPDPLPFSRGATFVSSNMKSLHAWPKATSKILALAIDLLKTHPLLATTASRDNIEVVDIEDARDIATTPTDNRIDKTTVVRYRYGESRVKVLQKPKRLHLSPDASYLLVGCLGGLGRSLTRWMMEHGARHFAFISRSGADKPEAARLIENINASGASTRIFCADASDEEAVRQVVASLHAERPIRGVVHGAMVLKDGMFEQMNHQSFADCVNPKAKGALNLHTELQSLNVDLDFFVLTSSISALLGNIGQANYSAANSALDALARQRHAAGLPATALVLPMVLDVGIVAENDAIEVSLLRKGLYGIDEHEMLQGFEAAMMTPRPDHGVSSPMNSDEATEINDTSQIVMGMEARELAKSMMLASEGEQSIDAYWYDDIRFCHVRATLDVIIAGKTSRNNSGSSDSFAATIKGAAAEGVEAVVEVIAKHIVKRVSSILMIPADDFELDGPSLGSYGLDSMIGAEMRTWLFKEFGLDYPFQKLLAPTLTFAKLAKAVAERMGMVSEST